MGNFQWRKVKSTFRRQTEVYKVFIQCTEATLTDQTYIFNHFPFFIRARLVQSSKQQLHVLGDVILCMQQ